MRVGFEMRCPKCNKYLPDRCICNGPSAEERRAAPIAAQLDQPEQPKSAFLNHLAESGKAIEGWPAWKTGLWNSDQAAQLDQDAERAEDEQEALADLRKAVQAGASNEWLLLFVRQFVRRAAPAAAQLDAELPPLPEHRRGCFARDGLSPICHCTCGVDQILAAIRPAWAVFADNGNVIIWSRSRSEVDAVAVKYGRPVKPIIAYIDGRTAGTAPEELIEVGNRMATTLEVLATALKNPGTAEGVRRTVAEWRVAAPSPQENTNG